VAVALRLAGEDPRLRGTDIGVLLTGGNVEPDLITTALDGCDGFDGFDGLGERA
jgi:hypothetical protein